MSSELVSKPSLKPSILKYTLEALPLEPTYSVQITRETIHYKSNKKYLSNVRKMFWYQNRIRNVQQAESGAYIPDMNHICTNIFSSHLRRILLHVQ
jgi:hypothetical protein